MDGPHLYQGLSVSWTELNVRTKRCDQLLCGRLHDKKQAIQDTAQRMLGRERQVVAGVQEHINCRRQGATSAVAQHHDELQAATKVLNRVLDASKHLGAQAIAGDANDEEIVRPLVEDQLDGYAGVGASQNGSKRTLFRAARCQTQIAGIDGNDPLYARLVSDVVKKRGEILVALLQPKQSGVAVRR
jgi:hypothetical protein